MEQGLYAQVLMLCRKYSNITGGNKNRNEDKFKFHGQSARLQHCFGLDFDWIEEHFITHEPGFYKTIYQIYDETNDINTFKTFVVPISNAKNVKEMEFSTDDLILKYCQNTLNSCCFRGLA